MKCLQFLRSAAALEADRSPEIGASWYANHRCPFLRCATTARYRVILDPLMESSQISSQPDALLRMAALAASGAHYCPVRFIVRDKAMPSGKLLLAFDAIAMSRVTGRLPHSGKLICGAQVAAMLPIAVAVFFCSPTDGVGQPREGCARPRCGSLGYCRRCLLPGVDRPNKMFS